MTQRRELRALSLLRQDEAEMPLPDPPQLAKPIRVTYASEAEARSDWLTVNPQFRTETMLAEMLARVRIR
jgi:hypothetical protein